MMTSRMTVGRYHVERLIAHGGMGSVYLARDPAIDRQVVIKLLKEGFDDAAARERFAREARSAGKLQHPNIVTVFDFGEHEDRPFIAMEYVRGETLAELIKRDRLLRISEKLAMIEDVCAALQYAHGVGIVHRDVKPANVMRLETGLVKVLDFGVARTGGGPVTRAGDVIGTLNYMSPEQLLGDPVDHRSDIYSVGALAYELFTLRMAFPGTIDTGVLSRILNASTIPIGDLVPGIDDGIAAIVERAMTPDVDARYQHLEQMYADVVATRTRLLETGADVEPVIDPNAETRVDSGRIASGSRGTSRRSSALGRRTDRAAASVPASDVPEPQRSRTTLFLGVACAALAGALIATVILRQPPVASPPATPDAAPRAQASLEQPDVPARPATEPPAPAGAAEARRDNVPPTSPEAGRTAGKGPVSPDPAARGVADNAARGKPGVKAPAAAQPAPVPPPPSPLPQPPPAPPSAQAVSKPPVEGSSPTPATTTPFPSPPAATPPVARPEPVPEPPAVSRTPSPEAGSSDRAAIQETLRRYAAAYQSLNSAEVARVMPSLNAQQMRDLQRDFSSYRSYTVGVQDDRIELAGATATVTCKVTRAFQTKNGVNGSNTVISTFHLRRTDAGWIIERLESR